jgi:hypothetical protein
MLSSLSERLRSPMSTLSFSECTRASVERCCLRALTVLTMSSSKSTTDGPTETVADYCACSTSAQRRSKYCVQCIRFSECVGMCARSVCSTTLTGERSSAAPCVAATASWKKQWLKRVRRF